MFRIFDNKEHKWITKDVYLDTNGNLCMAKKSLFDFVRLVLLSKNRYTYHNDIGLCDKTGRLIFEGDIAVETSLNIIGTVAYIPERAAYCLLDEQNYQYYTLGKDYAKRIKVIGNVFEGYNLESDEVIFDETKTNKNGE